MADIYFTIKTSNADSADKILKKESGIELGGLNVMQEALTPGVPVFIVLGGDRPAWDTGLIGIGSISKSPYDIGYQGRNYKIQIDMRVLLKKPIKREALIPYRDTYGIIAIGPSLKGEPNQALTTMTANQAAALIRAMVELHPDTVQDIKTLFKNYDQELLDKAFGNARKMVEVVVPYGKTESEVLQGGQEDSNDEDIADKNKSEFRKWLTDLVDDPLSSINSMGTVDGYVSTLSPRTIEIDGKVIRIYACSDSEAINQLYIQTLQNQKNDGNPSHNRVSSALLKYKEFLEVKSGNSEKETVALQKYTKDDFLSEVFMSSEQYDKLRRLLYYKKNIILQGAPGVGKSFLAKRFAYSLIGEKDDHFIEMVQFHQNYCYEDFVMGYKPSEESFELKEGIFYEFRKKAHGDPDHDYFFIIDEINRGNLSKIFGELMLLIEGDKRGKENSVSLAYRDEGFYIPENIYFIGMMNTADRSLAMMDYALRRRFCFFEIEPAFDKPQFKQYLNTLVKDKQVEDQVINKLSKLNAEIADEDNSGLGRGFCIGHSYFCNGPAKDQSAKEWYESIVEYELAPLLYEYWWDDKSKAEDSIKALLKYE